MSSETNASLAIHPPGILVEEKRLDGNRHGARGQADAPQIDVVEIDERNAVDREDLAFHPALLAQDRTEGLRHVAVEHDVDRVAMRERMREAEAEPFGER